MDFELVKPESLPESQRNEIAKALKEHKDSALRAFLTGKTPKKVIFTRPARGGSDVPYVPGWWFIDQANLLFGHLWSHEVPDYHIGENFVYGKSRVTVHIPGSTITEIKPDGTKIITEFQPLNIVKEQFGGSDIKKYTTNNPKTGKMAGDIIDLGDDLKSMGTEGMKKCLTELGFAADVYGKRETSEEGQASVLITLGKKKGLDKTKLDEMAKASYQKPVDDLSESERLKMIGTVRALPNI